MYSPVEGQLEFYGYENRLLTLTTSSTQLYQPLIFPDATTQNTAWTGLLSTLTNSGYNLVLTSTGTVYLPGNAQIGPNVGGANSIDFYSPDTAEWIGTAYGPDPKANQASWIWLQKNNTNDGHYFGIQAWNSSTNTINNWTFDAHDYSIKFPDNTRQTTAWNTSTAVWTNQIIDLAPTNPFDQTLDTTSTVTFASVIASSYNNVDGANLLVLNATNTASSQTSTLQIDPIGQADLLLNGANFHFNAGNTGGITFPDNTTQTTAFTGQSNNPFDQSLNTVDSVIFNNVTITNTLTVAKIDFGGGAIVYEPNGIDFLILVANRVVVDANDGIFANNVVTNSLVVESYTRFNANLLPQNDTFNIGTDSSSWGNLYANTATLANLTVNISTLNTLILTNTTSSTSTSYPAEGLLVLDGATDSSTFAQTLTFTGGAATSSAIDDPWATETPMLFINGGNVTVPYDADFNFGSGNFTIDFWFYALDDGTYSPLGNWNGSSGLLFNAVGSGGQQILYFYGPGPAWQINTPAFNINEWHHIAVSRNSGVVTIWLDGVAGQTHNSDVSFIAEAPLNIGSAGGAPAFNGYMTGVRIVDYLALWSSDFTPPVPSNGDYDLHTYTVSTSTTQLATITFPDTTVQTTAFQGNQALYTTSTATFAGLVLNNDNVILGNGAGTSPLINTIAIGHEAGFVGAQGDNTIAIGYQSGANQNANAVAVGNIAGNDAQGASAVAVGYAAGQFDQGPYSVAIGYYANASDGGGGADIGTASVAVGSEAGRYIQGDNAIAIGNQAGKTNQTAGSIILNASGSEFNDSGNAGFYVNPIRSDNSPTDIIYFNSTTNELTYGATIIGYTGSQGDIGYIGSQGDVGYVGSQGDLGYTGSQGDLGYVGSQGDIGYTGSQGDIGYVGSQGDIGYVGSQGDIGYVGSIGIGYVGSAGTIGTNGYNGSQGTTGYVGSAGTIGTNGYNGSQGTTGYVGSAGTIGTNGYTGSAGTSGSNGYTGSQGNIGYVGSIGIGYVGSAGNNGYTGSAGTSGTNGYTGSAGTSGTNGYTGSAAPTNLPQTIISSNYTTVIGDAGGHLYYTTSTTATITLSTNSSVAYALGSIITVISGAGAGVITITSGTNETLLMANSGFTGARTLNSPGIATVIRVTTTTWFISGAGLS